MSTEYIEAKCIEINQPIGTFYICSINWHDLVGITQTDIRRIEKESSNDDFERVIGIQRELSQHRVKEIGLYVQNVDATFPSSIILSIKQFDHNSNKENIVINKEKTKLKILKKENIANVIDGQHRIEGLKSAFLSPLFPAPSTFELNVTIFVDMDIEDQAMVFATINKSQTKVNKSIVYDLYEYTKSRSPQKTCHNIVKLLNSEKGSPFKDKIKILGKADDKYRETITQATLVDCILQYVSENPPRDRLLLRKKMKIESVNQKNSAKYIFREYFLEENDAFIAKIIWNYFSAVSQKWPEAWDSNIKGNILNRTTGIIALFKFLGPVYNELKVKNKIPSVKDFFDLLNKAKIKSTDFTPQKFAPGSSGHSTLFLLLKKECGLK
ncbi:DGQHR domain-containing protein [Leptospira paudalimensis]|uniref:DGQHR domain-containing protein n=1 Tax=Leptospira paudalimensis TaxID=2950024 RepID=A0ABT3M5D6_9LEPT|nr:DGQHR domain-containing protein [Leptospira paudalimensis]MCW7503578.1 DGQHR domain-containing protein [Leptospira paudalimensis]